ncbi:SRPBCC family protein [Labilibacter marinus]|uniref:hypothetical protein n=1 Tax=Labilibacter marinus TaxID=1477105 RepID=UPI00117BD061|nr:hypothetical protein [Labilibacter marinus]
MVILVYFLIRMLLNLNPAVLKEKAFVNASMYYSEWVCVKDAKGIALYERWVKVNDSLNVRERKGEFEVESCMEDVVRYLNSHETIKEWMKGIKVAQKVGDPEAHWVYMEIQLPWPMSNRDLIAKYSVARENKDSYYLTVQSGKGSPHLDTELVRIKDYKAVWKLKRVGHQKTKITFTTFSSEPPMFPQWVQEPVLKNVFYANLRRLKNRLS